MAIGSNSRPRHLPEKNFPAYAYLPGSQPHPIRDPAGHSYLIEPMRVSTDTAVGSDPFLWGLDLFNYGYYWEAHEAWESLWQVAEQGSPSRAFFKALILLSAAGVKIREGKTAAALRHSRRAAMLFRLLNGSPEAIVEEALGLRQQFSPTMPRQQQRPGLRCRSCHSVGLNPCLILSLLRRPRLSPPYPLANNGRMSGKMRMNGRVPLLSMLGPLLREHAPNTRLVYSGGSETDFPKISSTSATVLRVCDKGKVSRADNRTFARWNSARQISLESCRDW